MDESGQISGDGSGAATHVEQEQPTVKVRKKMGGRVRRRAPTVERNTDSWWP
jgi:hypothetical protein